MQALSFVFIKKKEYQKNEYKNNDETFIQFEWHPQKLKLKLSVIKNVIESPIDCIECFKAAIMCRWLEIDLMWIEMFDHEIMNKLNWLKYHIIAQ